MLPHLVKTILVEEFHAEDLGEDTFAIEPERRLVALVAHDNGIMQVPRVRQVRFCEHFIVLTGEDTRYYIEPEVIFGLKGDDPDLDKGEQRPGFRR